MNYDTFLFKGHGLAQTTGAYDPGATSNSHQEAKIVSTIVDRALQYLKPLNIKIHTSENNFTDKDTKNNTYKYKSGLSVHINAGGGTGTEAIVPLGEKYLTPDLTLITSISSLLGIPNRGLKSRDYYNEQFIKRTNGTAFNGTDYYGEIRTAWKDGISLTILEIGFIDTNDINLILSHTNEIAYAIAVYIASLCSLTLPQTTPIYTVMVKDLHIQDEAVRLLNELKCRGYNAEINTY